MPPSALASLLAPLAFAINAPAIAQPSSQTPTVAPAAAPALSPTAAYNELVRISSEFKRLVDSINTESGRDTAPKLRVAFGWAKDDVSDSWPDDYAPRADFIKLADRAAAEARATGLLAAFANVARSPSIEFPPHDHTKPDAFKLTQIREMLRMHEYMLKGTTDPAKAVELLLPCFEMGRLLATGGGVVTIVGWTATRDTSMLAMPWIAENRLDAPSRAHLAHRLAKVPPATEVTFTRMAELYEEEVANLWRALPPDLFKSDPDARRAWNALDNRTRQAVEFASGVAGENLEFPLPNVEAIAAEYFAARDAIAPMLKVRPSERPLMQHRMSDDAKTSRDRRVAGLTAAWMKAAQTADEAGLVVDGVRVALALEAFRADTGAYPDALTALVPKHLDAVPADPGAPELPLLYRKGEFTVWDRTHPYVLYSRGGDGVDNNATPFSTPRLSLWGGSSDKGKDLILNALRRD